eukprot:1820122-Amphidinium_carterae.1
MLAYALGQKDWQRTGNEHERHAFSALVITFWLHSVCFAATACNQCKQTRFKLGVVVIRCW